MATGNGRSWGAKATVSFDLKLKIFGPKDVCCKLFKGTLPLLFIFVVVVVVAALSLMPNQLPMPIPRRFSSSRESLYSSKLFFSSPFSAKTKTSCSQHGSRPSPTSCLELGLCLNSCNSVTELASCERGFSFSKLARLAKRELIVWLIISRNGTVWRQIGQLSKRSVVEDVFYIFKPILISESMFFELKTN